MEKLYTVSKYKSGSWLCLRHKLIIAKFRLKLKKVGKTTRPFRYEPKSNPLWLYSGSEKSIQGITSDCLSISLKNYGWRLLHCKRGSDQDHPQEKEMQKGKMVVWGGLTNSCEMKRSKKQRRKRKILPFECRVPKNRKEREESLPQWSMQRNRGKQYNGKTRDFFKKTEIPRGYFMRRWAQ